MASFALALELLIRQLRWGRYLAMTLLAIQIGLPFYLDESYEPRHSVGITFDEFYSAELFRDIQGQIGESPSSYRVLSVGMPPGVALYNGFHTLDAYLGTFPRTILTRGTSFCSLGPGVLRPAAIC